MYISRTSEPNLRRVRPMYGCIPTRRRRTARAMAFSNIPHPGTRAMGRRGRRARALAGAIACAMPAVARAKTLKERIGGGNWFATANGECECLLLSDPRWKCAPRAYAEAFPADVAEDILKDALRVAERKGWERERDEVWGGLDETRQVDASALSERVRRELRSAYEKTLIPLAREQCVIDDHLKFEDDDWYVVRYDAKEFPRASRHRDGGHMTFVVSLNNVTEYEGGGSVFEGLAFSVPHGGVHKLEDHDIPAQPIGGTTVHGSQLMHWSNAVTSGTRYVLVGETTVNKSCCWDMTAHMNRLANKAMVIAFFFLAIVWGVLGTMMKNIQKARNGGKEKVW